MKAKTQNPSNFEQSKAIILYGSQSEGHTLRLHPGSLRWLQKEYPDRDRIVSVYIGFDKRQDIQLTQESVWTHVANLLTGLSLEELNQLGGFTVVNPVTNQEVYNSLAVYA